jgi:type I restriction-modification system DNA methylase subunit
LGAADILRGSLDPSDHRQPIMTLLFIKRLNDTFEETAEKIIQEGKNEKEALCQIRSCSQKETCNRNKLNY